VRWRKIPAARACMTGSYNPSFVEHRRRSALFLLLVASALVAGPGPGLAAVSPCASGSPMTCCGGDENSAPVPCGCWLNAAPPSPAVIESAPPDVVLAEAPAPALVVPPPSPDAPPVRVTPRARAAPLFVLFVAFMN
jgi:hypothetical protein